MIEVRVPASSANIGSGFDCFGIALSLYNTISVSEIEKGLYISNAGREDYIPTGENNLIYRSVLRVYNEVGVTPKGFKIRQKSFIPMTRGLGSSSACIIGGMLAANALTGRQLDMQRIFELATEFEGHPDNVCAALYGGFCLSCVDDDRLIRKTLRINPELEFVAMVPRYFTVTKKSRGLLPTTVSMADAAYNISHATGFALAMATGDFSNLDIYCNDRLHQQYRKNIVEDMDRVFEICKNNGALAYYLSGSGPTIIAIIHKSNHDFVKNAIQGLEQEKIQRRCMRLSVDNIGAILKEIKLDK